MLAFTSAAGAVAQWRGQQQGSWCSRRSTPVVASVSAKARRARVTPTAQFQQPGGQEGPLFGLLRFARSGTGQVVLWGFVTYLVLSGQFFEWVFAFLAFAFVSPIIFLAVFRWWLGRNTVQGQCANCRVELTAIKGNSFSCPNCGQTIDAEEGGSFTPSDPSDATIDIEAD